ncbi:MAG: hypothetical protein HKM23_06860 [Nitrosopumilus sp.]|nr:hypothetical protein [Nitrosopumilus sp.]
MVRMRDLEFFMDVSPMWWLKAREDKKFLKKYVFVKFEQDYYPRIISHGRTKIDLDESGKVIKSQILDILKNGNFDYEFLPEDENQKESYEISNGRIHFKPRRRKINARLLIKVKIPIKKYSNLL